MKNIGSIISFDEHIKTNATRTVTSSHTLMVFNRLDVYENTKKLNEEFYGNPFSIGDRIEEDVEDCRAAMTFGVDDDPEGYGSGNYTQFYCHDRTGRRVRLLIEWEAVGPAGAVREMWFRRNGRWENIDVPHTGNYRCGKKVEMTWM